MQRVRIGLISFSLFVILLMTMAFTNAVPPYAIALVEGRTYDQAHDTGYIDWSGSVQYVYLAHRDNTNLPPEEGGSYCGSGCSEWVTRLGNGGMAGGSFDRNVSYFEAMVAFSSNASVGNATLRACSAVSTWNLDSGSSLPGFVSMALTVPAGCRSWSLSASGGYVDFRSIDVTYVGPPSTATPTPSRTPTPTSTLTRTPTATFTQTLTKSPTQTFTATFTQTNAATATFTFTPTFTPTNTATSTFTFTPTATYTNTPSPTPTPLPPQITGLIVCDLWGDAGWCRGNETLDLSASDPQGFDVTINGDLNGVPFTCGSSCDLPLPEGTGIANYTVTATSGQTASGGSTWHRDGTPPDLDINLPPVDGRNGWYVSEVDLLATATDLISGFSSLLASTDNGTTWIALPIHLLDGSYSVLVRARDVAGNEVMVSRVIRVDTVPPIAQITSHSNGEVVQGEVRLSGSLMDGMSGPDGGEISTDRGNTWQSVSMDAGDDWFYIWHSGEVINGDYIIQMRGRDRAGNLGDVDSVMLTVDNGPPAVSITERWWIWESGLLNVSPNHFPIARIQVTIRDPQNRWPAVRLNFDPGKNSYPVKWDRRFANGMLAPSGEYLVLAEAYDVNGLCGQDTGRIMIPVLSTSTATLTPSPTMTITLRPSATFMATQIPPTQTPVQVLITPLPEKIPKHVQVSLPLWQLLGLLGVFIVIASTSMVDPRPAAIGRLSRIFALISKTNASLDTKE